MKQANLAGIRSSFSPLLALGAFAANACGAPDPALESETLLIDVQATQAQSGLPFGIDPVTGLIIPPPRDPNVDPNSGINYDDMSNQAVDTGGACAENVVQSGPCPSYGIQCTVNTGSSTLYCTCLSNNSRGIQGWECR